MSKEKLAVVMIARDAEHQICRALASVAWADEICVLDTGSTDATMQIALRFTPRVSRIEFAGFGAAKQAAVALASHHWVLSLDSDEIVSAGLQRSLLRFLENPDGYAGAEFRRVTNFCGRWVLHSGWEDEYVVRLFDRHSAAFDDKRLHESVRYQGRIARLPGIMLHYSYPDLRTYLAKIYRYSRLRSAESEGVRPPIAAVLMLVKPVLVFVKKFIVEFGFTGGLDGLWIAALSAYGQFLRYYYVLARQSRTQPRPA